MRYFLRSFLACCLLLAIASCSATRELTLKTVEPSPVDFSNQVRKIGIVNTSKINALGEYTTPLEQLLVFEQRWLAENGTEAALTGLLEELAQDQRFDTVRILDNSSPQISDFGTNPSLETWEEIAAICESNGVDAFFALATHETDTKFSIKKTKMEQLNMMRVPVRVSAQEITLETLIENGWRIYDPKRRMLVDEFTSNEAVVASAKGVNATQALQAIDQRRETLLEQSKKSGSSYGLRMLPQKLDIVRTYYIVGTQNFKAADDKVQNGDYLAALKLWEAEITNPKARIRARACYNLAVLSEYSGDLTTAMNWATKSFNLHADDATLDYMTALENRQAQKDVLREQLANTIFDY